MNDLNSTIDRRTFATAIVAGAATSLLGFPSKAQAATSARNVVFIHGLFADGSCWSEVIGRLQSSGLRTTSVQNTLRNFDDDVALTKRALAMQDGPTVLVAHSFGGMILTQAGVDPAVSALVYVAARAPDANENYSELAARFPAPPAGAGDDWDRIKSSLIGNPRMMKIIPEFVDALPGRVAELIELLEFVESWLAQADPPVEVDFARFVGPECEHYPLTKLRAELIADGEAVALDSGTTVAQTARALAGRRLTVMPLSLHAAMALAESASVQLMLTLSPGW